MDSCFLSDKASLHYFLFDPHNTCTTSCLNYCSAAAAVIAERLAGGACTAMFVQCELVNHVTSFICHKDIVNVCGMKGTNTYILVFAYWWIINLRKSGAVRFRRGLRVTDCSFILILWCKLCGWRIGWAPLHLSGELCCCCWLQVLQHWDWTLERWQRRSRWRVWQKRAVRRSRRQTASVQTTDRQKFHFSEH